MKRIVLLLLLFGMAMMMTPAMATAGVEPSPFRAPGQFMEMWTPPGQIADLVRDSEPSVPSPGWTIKGFDPQPEPPGKVKDMWTPPGQIEGLVPETGPQAFTPVAQANIVLY